MRVSDANPRPLGGVGRLRRGRTALFLCFGLLATGTMAHASYYEPNAPYRFGTGGATIGHGVDVDTALFHRGGEPELVPGPVPDFPRGPMDAFATDIDVATGAFRMGGPLASIPGRVPMT